MVFTYFKHSDTHIHFHKNPQRRRKPFLTVFHLSLLVSVSINCNKWGITVIIIQFIVVISLFHLLSLMHITNECKWIIQPNTRTLMHTISPGKFTCINTLSVYWEEEKKPRLHTNLYIRQIDPIASKKDNLNAGSGKCFGLSPYIQQVKLPALFPHLSLQSTFCVLYS